MTRKEEETEVRIGLFLFGMCASLLLCFSAFVVYQEYNKINEFECINNPRSYEAFNSWCESKDGVTNDDLTLYFEGDLYECVIHHDNLMKYSLGESGFWKEYSKYCILGVEQ